MGQEASTPANQEASSPVNQRGSKLTLPHFDIEYPKGSSFTTEQEQPEPCDNVKNQVPDYVLDNLSNKVNSVGITETKKKTPQRLIYHRRPEQLQKDAEEIFKPSAVIPLKSKNNLKRWKVNINGRAVSKDRHKYKGQFASTDKIVSIQRNRLAIVGQVEDQI